MLALCYMLCLHKLILTIISWGRNYHYPQTRKGRPREITYLTQGLPDCMWWSQALNSVLIKPLCFTDASGPRDIEAGMRIPSLPTWQYICVASLGSNTTIQLTETWRNWLLQECHSWSIVWENGLPCSKGMDPSGNQPTCVKRAPTDAGIKPAIRGPLCFF